jgi:hypothetical protein
MTDHLIKLCQHCGRPLVAPRARSRFCGTWCSGQFQLKPLGPPTEAEAHRIRDAEIARFMKFVSPEPMSGCWLWTGSLNAGGYGQFMPSHCRKPVLANRQALEFWRGPLAPGFFACHRCDNRPCVNPDHLFAGTHRENTADAVSKGRYARGSRAGAAKLTEPDVVLIRRRCAGGEMQRSVAADFGVDPSIVSMIMSRHIWAHVPDIEVRDVA